MGQLDYKFGVGIGMLEKFVPCWQGNEYISYPRDLSVSSISNI